MHTCPECGFGYAGLPRDALAPLLRSWAAQHAARLVADPSRLRSRPAPGVWSPLEYTCHVRDVLGVQRDRVLLAQRETDPVFVPMGRDERAVAGRYAEQDPTAVAVDLRAAGAGLAAVLDALQADGWSRTGVHNHPSPALRDVDWIARHTLHELVHHLMDVDRGLGAAAA